MSLHQTNFNAQNEADFEQINCPFYNHKVILWLRNAQTIDKNCIATKLASEDLINHFDVLAFEFKLIYYNVKCI